MVELVEELQKRNTSGAYDAMIAEAKAGEFHDFKNEKYTCGKVELADQLSKFPELTDIRTAVIQGEYDEQADEDDKARMREDLKDSPELRKILGLE